MQDMPAHVKVGALTRMPLGHFQAVSPCRPCCRKGNWRGPHQLLTCRREKVSLSLVVCWNARLCQLGPALSDSASGDPLDCHCACHSCAGLSQSLNGIYDSALSPSLLCFGPCFSLLSPLALIATAPTTSHSFDLPVAAEAS